MVEANYFQSVSRRFNMKAGLGLFLLFNFAFSKGKNYELIFFNQKFIIFLLLKEILNFK